MSPLRSPIFCLPTSTSTATMNLGPGPARSPSRTAGSLPSGPSTVTWLTSAGLHRGALTAWPHAVPGFQDSHVHAPFAGRNRLRVWLNDVIGREEYLTAIAEYAAANPDEPWIVGGGWAMECFPGGLPLKEDLDAIVPDRPVFLFNRDVHGAWVNSKALEIAGITKDTADPSDGRIERDADTGEPTGMLHEGSAYTFNDTIVPLPDRPSGRRRS